MAQEEDRRRVTVVTACLRADGLPDFALTEVEVTREEYEDGVHYELAAESLGGRGYEEPYVHFDENEAPRFLLPAVQEYLGPGGGRQARVGS